MKLFLRWLIGEGGQSRQVAEFAPQLIHGCTGTKATARYDSLVSDIKPQLGYAQDLGRGPLLTGV